MADVPTPDRDPQIADVPPKTRFWKKPTVIVPVGLGLVVVLVAALAAFQPWKLLVNDVVDEAAPAVATSPAPAVSGSAAPSLPTGPVRVASGNFISHEHETNGKVSIIALEDGSNVLRIENLDTSNGPDLKVWVSQSPVIPGTDGWRIFGEDKYDFVDLGPLKGNIGNQNYKIPNNVNPLDYQSITIWCDRFSVSFGAAELKAVK
jgi:hypothetical protein